MVKVWYEPPPYGPGTSLNRPTYGLGNQRTQLVQQLSRRPPFMVVSGAIVTFMAIAYIPISELRRGVCCQSALLPEISVPSNGGANKYSRAVLPER